MYCNFKPERNLALAAAAFCMLAAPPALQAQSASESLAATAAVRPVTAAPNINILLVPFDSLSTPPAPAGGAGQGPAITPLRPPASEDEPGAAPGVVATGAAAGVRAGTGQVETRLAAKKKSNKPHPDDELFKLEPETSSTRPTQPAPAAAGRVDLPVQLLPPASVAPLPAAPPLLENASGGPGPAQNAAAPLRRALLKVGFLDVLTSPPDGPAIRRVINEHRLSPRVLKSLQENLRLVTASGFAPPGAPAVAAGGAESETAVVAAEAASPVNSAESQAKRDPVIEQIVLTASRLGQATGYRSVVLLTVQPLANAVTTGAPTADPQAANPGGAESATYTVVVVDSLRGTSEILSFDSSGADWMSAHEGAASTSASWLLKRLGVWPEVTESQKAQMAAEYFQQAKLMARVADPAALEVLGQSLALDGSRPETQVLLGDLLRPTDPAGAAAAYRRALELDTGSTGETWEKMAVSYAASKDWPRTLEAANRALAMRHDSALLQRTMAIAQFGRAELFRQADRYESAEDAQNAGRAHLERARAMSPDDPAVSELLARQLVAQGRYAEAASTLDELMTRIEPSLELQELYATALTERRGREVEAFTAWSRVWQQNGARNVPLNGTRYRRLAEGFDQYAVDLARQAAQQAAGVAGGTVPRESALLQVEQFAEAMNAAIASVKIMQPPLRGTGEGGSSALDAAHAAREFAANLLGQALESYTVFIETGDESRRSRGLELHRQAVNHLNLARGGNAR